MVSERTAGVEVMVETTYLPQQSNDTCYVFAYKVIIQNHNSFTVQLLRRRWQITNGFGDVEVVEGEGVVGRQPILYPGDAHEYVSGCHLPTDIGKMVGKYYFENKVTHQIFEVKIPVFLLQAPHVLN